MDLVQATKEDKDNGVPTPAGREPPPGPEACTPSRDVNGTDHHGPAGRGDGGVVVAEPVMALMVTTETANPTDHGVRGERDGR